jgi:hypothetical protein
MPRYKFFYPVLGPVCTLLFCPLILRAETPPSQPSTNNITIFDDRVFNLDGGTVSSETRQGANGANRYLDKTKELDYNAPDREKGIAACQPLKERNFKAFRECVAAHLKQSAGGRTNFGTREPRTGSGGVNAPESTPRGTPLGKPPLLDLKPSQPDEEPSGERSIDEKEDSENAE